MRVVIIGGGISGLATAWRIERLAVERGLNVYVTLLEKAPATGGKMGTFTGGGYTCETGPNGFLANKPSTIELCKGLGLDAEFLFAGDLATKRFIYSEKELHAVPAGPLDFFRSNLLSVQGRMRILAEPFAGRPKKPDESIHEFGCRRLGREAALKILNPMVSGVFAGATEALSLKSCFPRIKELEDDYGGLIKAFLKIALEKIKQKKDTDTVPESWPSRYVDMIKTFVKIALEKIKQEKDADTAPRSGPAGPGGVLTSFPDGMQTLAGALTVKVSTPVHINTAATAVSYTKKTKKWKVSTDRPRSFDADACVLAVPSYAASKIVRDADPVLADVLDEIPYSACAVMGLGFERSKIRHPLDGFGFLVPSGENLDFLGCLFTSSIFAGRVPDGRVLLRVFTGGYRRPQILEWGDEKIFNRIMGDLGRILGIKGNPEFMRIFRHEWAIPQYTVGHADRLRRMEELRAGHKGLFITGNAFKGVAVNDCTREAESTAVSVLDYLAKK